MDKESHKRAEAEARASFAQRLREAFVQAGRLQLNGEPDRKWLAQQIGISVQAIGNALDPDKPDVFSAYTTEKAAQALGVDAYWLATGEVEHAEIVNMTDADVALQMAQLLQDIAKAPDNQRLHALIAAVQAVAKVTRKMAAQDASAPAADSTPTTSHHHGPETETR